MENQNETGLEEVQIVSVEKRISQAEAQKAELKTAPDVINISKNIDIKDQISILEFGKEPAEGISQFSGRILNNMSVAETQKSTVMLNQLGKIMDKFEPEDFAEEKKDSLVKYLVKEKILWRKLWLNIKQWAAKSKLSIPRLKNMKSK